MKRRIILTSAVAILAFLGTGKLVAQFTLTGEIRPRSEYRHGFKKLINDGEDAAFFTEQRSRLTADFKQDKLTLKISIQDVRIWGAVNQIYKSDPALSAFNEAWGQYAFTEAFSVKAGRQELNYDNARFLGNLGWAQQSRSHDVLLAIFESDMINIHGGIAFNQDANTPEFKKLTSTYYSGVNNYKAMQYAWFNKKFDKHSLSLLVLNNGIQTGVADTSDISYSQTYGLYGKFKPGSLVIEGEAYYQGGKDAGDNDISAYLLSASVGYTGMAKFKPSIGGDYLSGNEADATKNNAFTPFYGTNHKFYGFMDYFYVGNPHGNAGLIDLYFKAAFPFGKKVKLLTHLHQFMSPTTIYNGSGEEMDSGLGTEVDLVLNVNLSSSTNLKMGYSQLFATETMEQLKGGSKDQTNNWAWLMLTFKPTLFTTKE